MVEPQIDLEPIGFGDPQAEPARETSWGRLRRELFASPKGLTGATIVLIAVLTAVMAPVLPLQSPRGQTGTSAFASPAFVDAGSGHLLGADNLGRDILSRTAHGARVSVAVGLVVISIAAVVGSLLGGIAGYRGGILDTLVMRLVDFQLSFPFILLAFVFVAILGPGFWSIVIALTVAIWVNYARLVRGETLRLRELEYVQAARTIGSSGRRILLGHVMPNVLHSILVLATLDLAFVIIFESSLTFLGLGVQPPTPSWGVMLSEGRNYLSESAWMTIVPGAALVVTVVGINLVGDWLRDVLDPSLRIQ